MRQPLIIVKLLFLLLTASNVLYAQENAFQLVQPETVGLSSDSLELMNAFFHGLVDEEKLAGVQIGVMRDGKIAHFDSYGYSNIEEETLIDENSIFRIFSMTKPIVSVALMQLYEQGKFKLEDPLYKYLPDFEHMKVYSDSVLVAAQNPIRIIDLLTHTSGFNYGRGQNAALNQLYAEADVHSSATNKEFVKKLSTLPLQFEPGTDWQYGLSTNICGYLIEVLSGQPLDEYFNEHIFEPLGMHDTHFQVPVEKIERFTVGYRWQEETGLAIAESQRENRYVEEVTLFNGGGGLVSTTFDYLKFCQMIMDEGKVDGNQILSPETIELMLKDHMAEVRNHQERLRLPAGEYGFGLGFAIRGRSAEELDKVYGWGGAVGTYFKIDVENNMTYVMMIQLSPHSHLGLRQLLQDYVESSIGK